MDEECKENMEMHKLEGNDKSDMQPEDNKKKIKTKCSHVNYPKTDNHLKTDNCLKVESETRHEPKTEPKNDAKKKNPVLVEYKPKEDAHKGVDDHITTINQFYDKEIARVTQTCETQIKELQERLKAQCTVIDDERAEAIQAYVERLRSLPAREIPFSHRLWSYVFGESV